jgi:hypothetical protein
LACHLSSCGITPVIIGGKRECEVGRLIRKACTAVIDLTGHTSISDLAAIGKAAAIAVGNDTGPLHVLAAVGAPTVILLSSASRASVSAPRGPNGEWPAVIEEPVLADLSIDRVIATVSDVLAGFLRTSSVIHLRSLGQPALYESRFIEPSASNSCAVPPTPEAEDERDRLIVRRAQ